MANFKGKSMSDVRLYVVDKPIFQVKNRDGQPIDRYWMNISAANDKFENEADFIDRPSLGFGRPYTASNGETRYDYSISYSKSQVDKMANAAGLDPYDYDVNDLRGKTFTGSLMASQNKTQKGLVVNTAKPLGVAEPLDKEAHDANTKRAAELREANSFDKKDASDNKVQSKTPTFETLEVSDVDLPF